MMWGYGFDGVSWLWMGAMMFFGLLGTLGVILLIVWLVRAASPGPQQYGYGGRGDDALEVARRRYASGEITREQYDELEKRLRR